jgi:hypothetical protein
VTDPEGLLKEDINLEGKVEAIDVQLVTNAVLKWKGTKSIYTTDLNPYGATNVADVQCGVSKVLHRK